MVCSDLFRHAPRVGGSQIQSSKRIAAKGRIVRGHSPGREGAKEAEGASRESVQGAGREPGRPANDRSNHEPHSAPKESELQGTTREGEGRGERVCARVSMALRAKEIVLNKREFRCV